MVFVVPIEQVSMPFPRSAQIKGGQARSTPSQQKAARSWALEHQPWKQSTGPKTSEGKAIASLNAEKGYFRRRLKSWEFPDLATYLAEVDRTTQLIGQLKEVVSEQAQGFEFVVKRWRSSGKSDRPWQSFSVKISLSSPLHTPHRADWAVPIWNNLRAIFKQRG